MCSTLGTRYYDVISELSLEAHVTDVGLDSGDQACDDVTFMLNAKAQVDDDWFVLDAVGQNSVEEYTLNAENRVLLRDPRALH